MTRKMKTILCLLFASLLLTAAVQAYLAHPMTRFLSSGAQIVPAEQWKVSQRSAYGKRHSEYSCQIPAHMGEEIVLCIKYYSFPLSVYLNDKLIYSYKDTGNTNVGFWEWVALPPDSAGKTLKIVVPDPGYVFDLRNDKVLLLGDHNTIYIRLFKDNMWEMLETIITILVGLFVCLCACILWKRLTDEERHGLLYLGTFILCSGIWIVTDSHLLQFLTGKTALMKLVSFLAFMLMPYYILKYIQNMALSANRGIFLLTNLHLINIAVCLLLHITRLVPLSRTLPCTHMLIIASFIVMISCAIKEIKIYHNSEMKLIMLGLAVLFLFAGLSLCVFYANITLPYSILFGIGISGFEICLLAAAYVKIWCHLNAGMKAMKYKNLAFRDSLTQLGSRLAFTQLQETSEPHSYFVFDVNDLKITNDQFGHQAGDQLITDAARCIQKAFGEIGTCYRTGGDEFAVALSTSSKNALAKAERRFADVIAQTNTTRTSPLSIAYGYSIQQNDALSADELYQIADANMYKMKQQMKGTCR